MSLDNLTADQRIRLAKLLELARRGHGGERETAQHMLERLLKKHGLTMADLESQELEAEWHEFTFKTPLERKLLIQVAVSVAGREMQVARLPKWRNRLAFQITRAQNAEISVAFSVYRVALEKEVDALFSAFAHVNEIFAPGGTVREDHEMTPEEREKARRASMMAFGMMKTKVNRQLEHKQ